MNPVMTSPVTMEIAANITFCLQRAFNKTNNALASNRLDPA